MCIMCGISPALGDGRKGDAPAQAPDSFSAFVSILPQAGLVERIGGELVEINVLVRPGQDPHLYDPTPRQMVALSEADVYFTVGLPFEERILEKLRSSNPDLFVVRTDLGVSKRALEATHGLNKNEGHDGHRTDQEGEAGHHGEEDSEHHHGEDMEHRHEEGMEHHHGEGEPDPHIWLGPDALEIQARNIYEGLVGIDPDRGDAYRRNLDIFLMDLHSIDAELRKLLEPYRGRPFFVFHPSFGYFADAYDLVQVPMEIEGKSPTPKQIEAIIEEARRNGVRIIFVQPQFDRRSAETIAEAIDGTVVILDPLERDVLKNLEQVALILQESMP
jgi:zinc transport system substrate-binding protein